MDLISEHQQEAAARTLAEAFRDDPLLRLLIPNDDRKRLAVAPWFFSRAIAYGMRWGQVYCNEDASAVAIWFPPEGAHVTLGRMLRIGMGALPFKIGITGTLSFIEAQSATEKFHSLVQGPHWYLMAIGTRPSRQGEGLGSALVEAGTSRADAGGLPCYLETATRDNVDFYAKRGFEITAQADVRGFTLFGMVRPPRRS